MALDFYWQAQQHHIYLCGLQKKFKDFLMFQDGVETFPCSLILSQLEQAKWLFKGKLSIFDKPRYQEDVVLTAGLWIVVY